MSNKPDDEKPKQPPSVKLTDSQLAAKRRGAGRRDANKSSVINARDLENIKNEPAKHLLDDIEESKKDIPEETAKQTEVTTPAPIEAKQAGRRGHSRARSSYGIEASQDAAAAPKVAKEVSDLPKNVASVTSKETPPPIPTTPSPLSVPRSSNVVESYRGLAAEKGLSNAAPKKTSELRDSDKKDLRDAKRLTHVMKQTPPSPKSSSKVPETEAKASTVSDSSRKPVTKHSRELPKTTSAIPSATQGPLASFQNMAKNKPKDAADTQNDAGASDEKTGGMQKK